MTIYDARPGGANRLLAPLPSAEADRLLPHLEPLSLALRQVLCQPDEPIAHVYFPRTTLARRITKPDTTQSVSVCPAASGPTNCRMMLQGEDDDHTRTPPMLSETSLMTREA